jgi:SAM-dependent methyltransferase
MYTNHTHCRACGYAKPGARGIKSAPTEKLIEVFDLGVQPLANDFCKDDWPRAGYAPLKVLYCPRCSLAQLSVVVDPSILYRHYSYVTSPSAMMEKHFKALLTDIANESLHGRSILEIGSNDGRLLAMMREYDYTVQGVDPADNLAGAARLAGIPTETGFFGEDLARIFPKYDIVIARHVFCHVDDWQDFVAGLEAVSHKDTLICIEVPYAGNTLKSCEFDQVCHEHLSFLSVKAMKALLDGTSLHIHAIKRYSIHGGAILLMLRHNDYSNPINSPTNFYDENITAGDWREFSREANAQIIRLKSTVNILRSEGKRIAGLGASAKSTVWINACGFTRKDIAFIADTTPQKQFTYSPGADIPIVDEGAILRELPDYVVMFAWNYRAEILEKFALARSKGVKFIVPIPTIEIV